MLGFYAECCIHRWIIIALWLSNLRPGFLIAMAWDRGSGRERPSTVDVLPKTNPCDFLPGPIRFDLLMETSR